MVCRFQKKITGFLFLAPLSTTFDRTVVWRIFLQSAYPHFLHFVSPMYHNLVGFPLHKLTFIFMEILPHSDNSGCTWYSFLQKINTPFIFSHPYSFYILLANFFRASFPFYFLGSNPPHHVIPGKLVGGFFFLFLAPLSTTFDRTVV